MRCDIYLVQQGYAESRSKAQVLIEQGAVCIDGIVVKKSSDSVDELLTHSVEVTQCLPFVGRGGLKLEYALEKFSVSAEGAYALDIGASTGGFTDCLLQRGAAHVIAVDAGENQLAPSLRNDARVTCIEKYNARYMKSADLEYAPDLVVMDVSFISQTLILPSLSSVMKEGATLVSLIKPQFEVGKSAIGKKGIVKKATDRVRAVSSVITFAASLGLGCYDLTRSPITGGDGNVEFLATFRKGGGLMVTEKQIEQCEEEKH